MKRIVGVLLATYLLLLPSPGGANGLDREDAIEPFSRDVFVVLGASLRNPTIETPQDEPLYNVAGLNLGVTWGEWQQASATSRAIQIGGPHHATTDFQLDFEGLVPNGVYSVFYATIGPDTENPLCPGVERSLALHSTSLRQQPDASSFVAGELGEAHFHARADGALLDATQVFLSLVYHADGQTYGELPNRGEYLTQGSDCRSSYGHDAMRQLLVLQKW